MRRIEILKALSLPLIITIFIGMPVAAQETPIPVPQSSEIVVWISGEQVAADPELKAVVMRNAAVGRYLELLNLTLEQVDYAVMLAPFDAGWVGGRPAAKDKLPSNAALFISGNFDPKKKYNSLKSKGWRETEYSNKKLLWWSTGDKYYQNPKGGECIGYITGGRLVVTGSESAMKEILDVAGKKKEGLVSDGMYQRLNGDFFTGSRAALVVYIQVTDGMRNLIKADTVNMNSAVAKNALEYIDHLKESGLSAIKEGDLYMVNGYLGMDSQNNSLVVASLLQIGGGLATLLPPGDPNRALLSNLTVSRQERTVLLQSNLTRQQLVGFLK